MLVDSNVWIDVFLGQGSESQWSTDHLLLLSKTDTPAINPLIYAEISVVFQSVAELDHQLNLIDHERLSLPYEAAPLAGRAFVAYRRSGGLRNSPLPDFYIGAHAQVAGLKLMTRDPKPYRTYFPKVKLICPL
jgi:predicted nucleic acid-binding protein